MAGLNSLFRANCNSLKESLSLLSIRRGDRRGRFNISKDYIYDDQNEYEDRIFDTQYIYYQQP